MKNINQLIFQSKKKESFSTENFGNTVCQKLNVKKLSLLLTLFCLFLISCEKEEAISEAEAVAKAITKSNTSRPPTSSEEAECAIIVDYAQSEGNMMKMTRGNGSSGTSALPGEASRQWLQGLYSKVGRVWIQQHKIYQGDGQPYNYNYVNDGGALEEDMLEYYSTTADELIVTLTGYKGNVPGVVAAGDTPAQIAVKNQKYVDFVRDNIIHYKRLFPKIKYITVGNEPNFPDDNGVEKETPSFYYEQGYKRYYQALHAANAILATEGHTPILLGTGGLCRDIPVWEPWADDFLALYKADSDPTKKLSFFNFHSYHDADQPIKLQTARQKVDNLMVANGLPIIPVFLTELGNFGGTTLPSGFTMAEAVTAQPACQLTKMFYLYEGVNGPSTGVSNICNWVTSHSTASMQTKVQLLDIANGYASPYGNALVLAQKLSSLTTRINAVSKEILSNGLGTHVLASKIGGNKVYILVWNYNHDNKVPAKRIKVMLKNIPTTFGPNRIQRRVYMIDSKNNNYFTNTAQNSLVTFPAWDVDYLHAHPNGFLTAPLDLETNSVALIELTSY